MNPTTARILGHAAGAAAGSTVWLVATIMPAAPADPWLVAAGVILPPALATALLLIQHAADAYIEAANSRPAKKPAPAPRRPEIVRPPMRRELTR